MTQHSEATRYKYSFFSDKYKLPGILTTFNHFNITLNSTNNLLFWEAIKFAIGLGKSFFDFGRSNKNSGVYIFKKRWGAIDRPIITRTIDKNYNYSEMDMNYGSIPFSIASVLWKRLPFVIVKNIGSNFRKYLP